MTVRSLPTAARALVAAAVIFASVRAEEPPSPAAVMTGRGYIRHSGAWRTPQEIELLERSERATLAQKEWAARLRRLRSQVEDPALSAAATEAIREMVDPYAVPAVVAEVSREPVRSVRAWYLEALGRIGSADAIRALVVTAIDHADPETRLEAAEELAARHASQVVPAAVAALGDADNARVNRAAELLGRLGDTSAVAALIEVLETRHTVVSSDGTPEGSTTATFTPTGGGLSLGGNRQTRVVTVRNPSVHAALVALSGVDFQWDTVAWRSWLANRDAPANFDPRRG